MRLVDSWRNTTERLNVSGSQEDSGQKYSNSWGQIKAELLHESSSPFQLGQIAERINALLEEYRSVGHFVSANRVQLLDVAQFC